jgi:hypothetical protein
VDDRRFADVQARVMAVLPAVERMSC